MRLAVSQQLSASTMPKFVAKFCDIHPNIQVTLTDCSVDDVVEHIENLEADLGVAPERVHSDDLPPAISISLMFCVFFFAILFCGACHSPICQKRCFALDGFIE